MTPDQISVIALFVQLISGVKGWPIGIIIFAIVIGPWMAAFLLVHFQARRFETVVKMYENNVTLVKDYAKLAEDLHDVVIMNTQTMTRLVDCIKTNQYCPAVRLEKRAGGVQ